MRLQKCSELNRMNLLYIFYYMKIIYAKWVVTVGIYTLNKICNAIKTFECKTSTSNQFEQPVKIWVSLNWGRKILI